MSDIIDQIAQQQFDAFTTIAKRLIDVASCYEHDISWAWDSGDFIIIHNNVDKRFKSGCCVANGQLQVEVNNIKNLPLRVSA